MHTSDCPCKRRSSHRGQSVHSPPLSFSFSLLAMQFFLCFCDQLNHSNYLCVHNKLSLFLFLSSFSLLPLPLPLSAHRPFIVFSQPPREVEREEDNVMCKQIDTCSERIAQITLAYFNLDHMKRREIHLYYILYQLSKHSHSCSNDLLSSLEHLKQLIFFLSFSLSLLASLSFCLLRA